MSFKPMLASEIEQIDQLVYHVLASPKLDGIRVVIKGGVPMTRSLKPIRNHYAKKLLSFIHYEHLDGEILVGQPNASDAMYKTSSGIMSYEGSPDFKLYVFDYTEKLDVSFLDRYNEVKKKVEEEYLAAQRNILELVEQRFIHTKEELLSYQEESIKVGYEGIMIRNPRIPRYKCGRSTEREGLLLKFKNFSDSEAKVIGFKELLSNQNELETDNLGYAKRSSAQENLVPMDTLGALVVTSPDWLEEFSIGSGFTAAQRQEIWNNREKYLGQQAKFKYQKEGVKDRPRFPRFIGFRPEE